MIDSIFHHNSEQQAETDAMHERKQTSGRIENANDLINVVLPTINRLVTRHFNSLEEGSDLAQTIIVKLLAWHDKYPEKSGPMGTDDWEAFAARVSINEINRYHLKNAPHHIPIEEANELWTSGDEIHAKSELSSSVNYLWQQICELSLRQRRAFLLHSYDFVVYLDQSGITDEQLAESLDFSIDHWLEIKHKIPLKDMAKIIYFSASNNERDQKALIASIKKARVEARNKLLKFL